MTQNSSFHNGSQIGDATEYSAESFHNVLHQLFKGSGGYIVPSGTTNTLGVTFSAGQTVSVAAGSAFVGGVYYNNSGATSIVLENNPSGVNRIDRIVIRVDWSTQTARVIAKRGTASSTPVAPSLQQEIGTIYEVPLAAVLVTPAFAGFGDHYIYDERTYMVLPESNLAIKNVMFNSEFMSGPSPSLSTIPFPMWRTTGTPIISYFKTTAAKFDNQARGRSLQITFASGDDFYTYVRMNNGPTTRAVVSFTIHITSGGPVDFSLDGGATTLYTIPRTRDPVVIVARASVGASGGNQALEPHFTASAAATFKLGQMTIAFGNAYAPFEPSQELVLQPYPYPLFLESNVGTGTDSFLLDDDIVWNGVKNGVVRQEFSNALSSTADTGFASLLNNYPSTTGADIIRMEIGRMANSVSQYQQGFLPLELQYDPFWRVAVEFDPIGGNNWRLNLAGVQT